MQLTATVSFQTRTVLFAMKATNIGTSVRSAAERHKSFRVRDITAAVYYLNTVSDYKVAMEKKDVFQHSVIILNHCSLPLLAFSLLRTWHLMQKRRPIRFALL